MAYSHITYAQFRAQLAARLSDPNKVFWVDAELRAYTLEAMRVLSAYGTYWRDRGVMNSVAGVAFYDLPTQLPGLLGYTVTDAQLLAELQYHLMESVAQTEMFSSAEMLAALQRRRDQFLSETGCVLSRTAPFTVSAPAGGRVALADSVIDVRRVAWFGMDGSGNFTVATPLFRLDELQLDYGLTRWSTSPDTPQFYSTIVSPPLTMQLAPLAQDKGQLELLTVSTGATLDGSGVLLGIPDDFAWVVKLGALADLLGKDGQARDPDRATYCESRFQQGAELARMNPTVLVAEIDGVDNLVCDLWDLDTARSSWQAATQAPDVVATAGRNLIALAGIPDDIYSVTVNVVRNAVVPSADGEFLQVGREMVDALLDYAEHMAAFKMQGAEWKATDRAMTNLVRQASQYNQKLQASALYKEILWPTSGRYTKYVPERVEVTQ